MSQLAKSTPDKSPFERPSDSAGPSAGPVLLFDGICNLCNAVVQFVIRRDPSGHVRFAALQSTAAAELLERHSGEAPTTAKAGTAPTAKAGGADGGWDSVICIDKGHVYTKSDAALHVARYLRGAWPLLGWLRVVPRPLRDALYDAIANRRYRWFGQRTTCMVPDQSLKRRFLE